MPRPKVPEMVALPVAADRAILALLVEVPPTKTSHQRALLGESCWLVKVQLLMLGKVPGSIQDNTPEPLVWRM